MMNRFIRHAFLAVFLLAAASAAAAGEIGGERWLSVCETALGQTRGALRARLGPPAASSDDEILSAEIDEYRIAGNDEGMYLGEIFYSADVAVAVKTRFHAARSAMNRFMAEYVDEIVDCGEHYMTARSDKLDAYLVVETRASGAVIYMLRAPFYWVMSDTGDLPPLPSPHEGRGHGP